MDKVEVYPHLPQGTYPHPQTGYYPPGPQQVPEYPYQPNAPFTGQPVITQQPMILASAPATVGPDPVSATCPACQALITTAIKHEPNTQTHLIALCLCCCVCWPCACLPYCIDSCQNTNHYCPNCNTFIGTYQS